jgi:hypothetical protein
MKALEKIYLYPYSTDGIYEVETKPLEGTVEYTRTDVFVEKAVNYLNCNLSGIVAIKEGNITQGLLRTKSEFIEDFKKFMKGE